MLAYVLWHHAAPSCASDRYASSVLAFHRSLRVHSLPGFRGSQTHVVPELPWTPRSGFEDWYFVDDFHSLGTLNEAAVTGPRAQPHTNVAALAGWGAGGLYRLRAGSLGDSARWIALWFSKPAGESYAQLFTRLESAVAAGAIVWGRELVLGPAPEFCIHASKAQSLTKLDGLRVEFSVLAAPCPAEPDYDPVA
jgi:hypothetical protein